MRATLILAIALGGCFQTPQEEARQVADAYMEKRNLAREGAVAREVTIKDEGSDWLVTYHLSEGHAGGDLLVWVDKRTMTPVQFIGGQ